MHIYNVKCYERTNEQTNKRTNERTDTHNYLYRYSPMSVTATILDHCLLAPNHRWANYFKLQIHSHAHIHISTVDIQFETNFNFCLLCWVNLYIMTCKI